MKRRKQFTLFWRKTPPTSKTCLPCGPLEVPSQTLNKTTMSCFFTYLHFKGSFAEKKNVTNIDKETSMKDCVWGSEMA